MQPKLKCKLFWLNKSKNGRTRKTEKEEDEEMMDEADHEDETNEFSFDESPTCRFYILI
jgi:hypothetical protein